MYQAGNIAMGAGVLSISAQRGAAGAGYVSGRITSASKNDFAPGEGQTLRIEARIQLPQGDNFPFTALHCPVDRHSTIH